MIGFFDSGLGGLTVLKEVIKILPEYSTIYLGDSARAPYGPRSSEIIYRFTKEGVTELFERGCPLVVLACNTASSTALRRLQKEFLPQEFPDRKILGVVRPAVEGVVEETRSKRIGVLGTEATIRSRAYSAEFAKIDSSLVIVEQACPLLVPLIEAGEQEWEGTKMAVKRYLEELFLQDSGIDSVLLACTHYPIIQHIIERFVPKGVRVYSQGGMVAEKLADYLTRHPALEERLEKQSSRAYFTTDSPETFRHLAATFMDREIDAEKIDLVG